MRTKIIKIAKLVVGFLLSILALGFMGYSILNTVFFQAYYHMEDIIFTYAIIILACVLASIILCSVITDNKYRHKIKLGALLAVFIYYCFLLIFLLFLSRSYRYISPITDGLLERIHMNSNLIPFRTIGNYLFNREHDSLRIIITNLLGNLLAFMPMAFFLPIYFKRLKRLLPYTLCMLGIILVVEVIQAITCIGFFDIDDFILNMLGTVIAFLMCKLKVIQRLVDGIVR